MTTGKPIVAICGKGGAGKTACCALLSRALLDAGVKPLLLIDADPVGGLASAVGERAGKTIGSVREQIIASARAGDEGEKERLAIDLDYLVLEALLERDRYAFLAMGHTREKGCYCPVNTLLRQAIDVVVGPFAAVLIDAEAGIEQINRQVTRQVSRVVVVTDGSARSAATLRAIAAMVHVPVSAVWNRRTDGAAAALPDGVDLLGAIPEDELLGRFDREGRPLWELPADDPAVRAASGIATALGLVPARAA
jgi:CO dehydrogenase maturation factor